MVDSLLFATDGTSDSDLAADYAIALAEAVGAGVHVLYVIDDGLVDSITDPATRETLEADLQALGEAAIEEVTDRSGAVSITSSIRRGSPHHEIVDEASDHELIVLGRDVEGSVGGATTSSRIITATDASVLSIPTSASDPRIGGFATMLAPTDGSRYPVAALEQALALTDVSDATVHGLYVIDSDIYDLSEAPRSVIGILREGGEAALEDLASQVDANGVRVRRHIRRGSVTPVILDAIEEVNPDVVAIGSRGRTAGSDPILGSTTRRLLQEAGVPVLMST